MSQKKKLDEINSKLIRDKLQELQVGTVPSVSEVLIVRSIPPVYALCESSAWYVLRGLCTSPAA